MNIKVTSIDQYFENIPEERKAPMSKLWRIIHENIPNGFESQLIYGMPGFTVPKSLYHAGYHVTPELPLPFINIASQKNFIALYHMGIYSDQKLLSWFTEEYPKHVKTKLDMGKSCIRFKNMDTIPFELIGELISKMTVQEWIKNYENSIMKK